MVTTLTDPSIRVRETGREISVCATKDIETAQELNVILETVDGTATGELWGAAGAADTLN